MQQTVITNLNYAVLLQCKGITTITKSKPFHNLPHTLELHKTVNNTQYHDTKWCQPISSFVIIGNNYGVLTNYIDSD